MKGYGIRWLKLRISPEFGKNSDGSWYGMFGTFGAPIYLGAWNRATKAQALKRLKAKGNPSLAKTGKWIKAKAVRIVGKTLQILK